MRDIDARAAHEKKELVAALATFRRETGQAIGNRLMRCAKVVAPAMPDNVAICFRFKNRQAELYIPEEGRGVPRVAIRPEDVPERAAKRRLIAVDYANGMSQSDIAKKYGISTQTVWAALFGASK
jgi:predicted DNA-binding protein (UPF0251 family)